MDAGKDLALENLDRGFQESKNIQILQFLNDQAEIANRLKTCRFNENGNGNNKNASGTFSPSSRVSTAPEAVTRTHRLRPLSARPSTASGRQYEEPDRSEREFDADNVSLVSGRRRMVVGRNRHGPEKSPSLSDGSASASSPVQRPETVCGFLEEVEEEEEDDGQYSHGVESDLDVLSIESITSTNPCDDIGDDEVDGVTYEFDVPESDRRHIEADNEAKSGAKIDSGLSSPLSPTDPPTRMESTTISSPKRLTSPTRNRPSAKQRNAAVPNIATTSSSNRTRTNSLPHNPHPPAFDQHHLPLQRGSLADASATSTVLRRMRTRSTSTDLHERGRRLPSSSSKFVWGDSHNQSLADFAIESSSFRPGSSDRPPQELMSSVPMSPRISFEELPIEKQGVKLRTVARIDCDASFYRKLRNRSAPAMRTDELMTSRSEGNSPVRSKPVGIYHLPPLSKEMPLPPSASSSSSSSSSSPIHPDVRSLTATEFLAQHQHKVVFQEPNLLH